MPSYHGKFQYLGQNGASLQQGSCQVDFDEEKFPLTPDSGAPLIFDLGDLDAVIAADYELKLPLFTGNTLLLQQFGKSYQDLSRELLENFRKRTLQCLLLEDMEEVERFPGAFTLEGSQPASGPAELRLFKSNLAILPNASQAFQWRLADITSLKFDPQNFEVIAARDAERLHCNRLAKRTEGFYAKLRETRDALTAAGGQALHSILPFLNPDQLRAAIELMAEGHSASTAKLAQIHSRIPDALVTNAVDKTLRPYYDELLHRTAQSQPFAGFKLIRQDDNTQAASSDEAAADNEDASALDADSSGPAVLYWFFFPIAAKSGGVANVVAWEASSQSGRATYFFRLVDPGQESQLANPAATEQAVARITRVLGLVNFRRRPIYLSDDELSANPIFHRYAIAARRIADLRWVRQAFLGRAIHSSLDAWHDQVNSILAKSGA
jgi:hypothetical protein